MSSFSDNEEKENSVVDRRSFRDRRMKLKLRRFIAGLILALAVAAVIIVAVTIFITLGNVKKIEICKIRED